jgi:6-methylsalicylate decarboxylase
VNRFSTMTIDLHQHLWPAPFLAALRARSRPPRLDGWTLELPGDSPYAVGPAAHDVERRAATASEDLIGVAQSAALGLDRLAPAESAELAAAWLDGALALPAPYRAWAMAGVREPDPVPLQAALDAGAIGLELAADVLAAPAALDRLAPLLDVLDAAQRPLLVHPGPATAPGRPAWWVPVVPYVAQLHAAWWAWADGGRERYPRLPVCFVALAGLGPLHGERQRARGGTTDGRVDPLTFVETSSYGTRAVDAIVRVLGIDVVCRGSDLPYAAPASLDLGEAALHAIDTANPGRLLGHVPEEVPA